MDKLKEKRRSDTWLRAFWLVALAVATIITLAFASSFAMAEAAPSTYSVATISGSVVDETGWSR